MPSGVSCGFGAMGLTTVKAMQANSGPATVIIELNADYCQTANSHAVSLCSKWSYNWQGIIGRSLQDCRKSGW